MSALASLKRNLTEDFARILPLLNQTLRTRSIWVFVLMVAQSLLELGFIMVLASMGLALTNSDGLRSGILYQTIFTIFPALNEWSQGPGRLLVLTGCLVVLISILKGIVSFFVARASALLGEDMSLSISKEIMSRYLYRDYAWHLSKASSTMFQRMLWRAHLGTMLSTLLTMYSLIVTVVLLFTSLVAQEPLLTTIVVANTLIVGIIFLRIIRGKVDANAKTATECSQLETSALMCATKGIREVLIYRQQETFLNALISANLKGRYPRTFNYITPTAPTWILEAVGFGTVVAAIAYLVFIEHAPIERISAALGLLLLTAWRVLPYCNRIISLQISVRNYRPYALAIIELLEELRALPPEHLVEPDPNFSFSKDICLKNLNFRYDENQKDCLRNINLCINKGEKIGLIGTSGGGKSTLAGVISGLLPPSAGNISVDGGLITPERAISLASIIGYVPQTPFLFGGTLAENIAFSEWGKPWDVKRVREACNKAAIDFVTDDDKSLRHSIGESGGGLSGGQAQRVSIARALYTNPSIIIFDEATSALDQHNERAIQDTIDALSDDITCIIIAHRLSTVRKCDKIVWIEDGEIIMEGPTAEVIKAYEAKMNL